MSGQLKFTYEAPNQTKANHVILNRTIHNTALWKLNDTAFYFGDLVH